ncbi:hypothetical protein WA026_015501 [Henosepilachna vigintioctopunctata]|uniref:Uncharacterized protein n=1 Tax=Henosepilachna vigintioctopunctata TaxID=420089 RepID=A0AAW1V766_9CUCU
MIMRSNNLPHRIKFLSKLTWEQLNNSKIYLKVYTRLKSQLDKKKQKLTVSIDKELAKLKQHVDYVLKPVIMEESINKSGENSTTNSVKEKIKTSNGNYLRDQSKLMQDIINLDKHYSDPGICQISNEQTYATITSRSPSKVKDQLIGVLTINNEMSQKIISQEMLQQESNFKTLS